MPTEKLTLTVTGSYTDSTAAIDSLNFPDPGGLAAASYDYDLSGTPEYSDLDIQQWSLEVDSEYEITPKLALGIGGAVYVYEDDDPYLFDESGELYLGDVSLSYVF